MFSGSFNTGLGLPSYASGGVAGAGLGGGAAGRVGVGVNTTGSKRSTSSGQASANDSLSEVQDFLQNQSKTQNWGEQRDAFYRATANSSSSDLAARSASLSERSAISPEPHGSPGNSATPSPSTA